MFYEKSSRKLQHLLLSNNCDCPSQLQKPELSFLILFGIQRSGANVRRSPNKLNARYHSIGGYTARGDAGTGGVRA